MPKHTEKVMVYDPAVRTKRGAYLEIEAPQTVLDALEQGCLSYEILAHATFGLPGNRCVIGAAVKLAKRG